MNPVFSVIIPTYNRETLLPRAINSVLNQTFGDFEILVVDDASTDETEKVTNKLQNHDKRIKYIRLSENGGVSVARNRGIKEAKGKYISLLDSDDEFSPEFLEETFQALENTPEEVGFCWTGTSRIKEKEMDDLYEKEITERIWNPDYENKSAAYRDCLTWDPTWGTGHGVTFKAAIFDQIDAFDENIRAREDIEIFLRLVAEYKFIVIPKCLINLHTDGQIRVDGNFLNKAEAYIQIYKKHESAINEEPEAYIFFHRYIADSYYKAGKYLYAIAYYFKVWRKRPLKLEMPRKILIAFIRTTLKNIKAAFNLN